MRQIYRKTYNCLYYKRSIINYPKEYYKQFIKSTKKKSHPNNINFHQYNKYSIKLYN